MPCRTGNVCRVVALAWLLALPAVAHASPPVPARAAQRDLAPRISTGSLPDAVTGAAYRFELAVEHGSRPYAWTITEGHLPDGINLEPGTGLIAGTPLDRTTALFTVRVEDAHHATATRRLEIRVADPLVVGPVPLPRPRLDEPYAVQLQARGGIGPLRWEILSGGLPPGITFDPYRGVLAGTPTDPGQYRIVVRVTDSSRPRQRAESGDLFLHIVGPLTVTWLELPTVRNGGIFGSLKVANGTREYLDVTVVVVAVNEYGKAFTLGYQRYNLAHESESPVMPFGFTVPRGNYFVRVDAVGHVPGTRLIRRAAREQRQVTVE